MTLCFSLFLDIARSLVKENDGVHCLIKLLKNLLEKDHLPDNMRTVTSGCLLNLTDTYGKYCSFM